jgi:hypothetical protein
MVGMGFVIVLRHSPGALRAACFALCSLLSLGLVVVGARIW